MSISFERLLSPVRINQMEIKNRMVVSAMVTNYCEENGMPTEKFMTYHEHKARGGFGLIITEDFAIHPTAGAFKRLPGLWTDEQIAPYRIFTDRIHRAGAKIVAQIYHAGRETGSAITGVQCVAPSPIKDPTMPEIPHELTTEEIHELQVQFAECARRAKEAGFDGVELHGAHGYLIGQFVSPYSNKRSDEYGGTIENRARFVTQMLPMIRERVGEDFAILYRMSVQEYVPGGMGTEDAKALAMLLEAAGVDCIHASQGIYASGVNIIPPSVVAPAGYIDNAAAIKSVVNIPVIGVGRINDPMVAESVLRSGKADLCTMARASLADPEMPRKVMEGRLDDIIHCIGCVQGCVGENGKGNCVRCLVNPMTGMEDEYQLLPASVSKKIAVIGGGVAGCEAAIVAAQRGHRVILLEKEDRLGGQWIAASVPVGKGEFTSFLVWQQNQLRKLQVEIRLGCSCSAELLKELAPDEVIIAAGSHPFAPPIKGLQEYGIFAQDVLRGCKEVSGKVVVVGGGLVGAETADFLAEHGCENVSILEMLPQIVKDGEPNPTYYLKERMRRHGVAVYTSAKVEEVCEHTVLYEHQGRQQALENVDYTVIAIGVRADTSVEEMVKTTGIPYVLAGDCNGRAKNGYLDIREGYEAGLTI